MFIDETNIGVYNKSKILYEILNHINNIYKKLKFIVKYFMKCNLFKIKLNEITEITTIDDLTNLQIIDNLHDFISCRINDDMNDDKLQNIRSYITNKISSQTLKNIISTNNVNTIRNEIFEYYKMSNSLTSTSEIPLSQLSFDDVYFETPGIVNVEHAICPYKNTI